MARHGEDPPVEEPPAEDPKPQPPVEGSAPQPTARKTPDAFLAVLLIVAVTVTVLVFAVTNHAQEAQNVAILALAAGVWIGWRATRR